MDLMVSETKLTTFVEWIGKNDVDGKQDSFAAAQRLLTHP
jgi:hypothetical protein